MAAAITGGREPREHGPASCSGTAYPDCPRGILVCITLADEANRDEHGAG